MTDLSNFTGCPEKLISLDGQKVVDVYKLKIPLEERWVFMVQFESGDPDYYPQLTEALVLLPQPKAERWSGLFINPDNTVRSVSCIVHPSLEAVPYCFNAGLNLDTLQVTRK